MCKNVNITMFHVLTKAGVGHYNVNMQNWADILVIVSIYKLAFTVCMVMVHMIIVICRGYLCPFQDLIVDVSLATITQSAFLRSFDNTTENGFV